MSIKNMKVVGFGEGIKHELSKSYRELQGGLD